MFAENTRNSIKFFLVIVLFGLSLVGLSQDSTNVEKPKSIKSEFWKRVSFGGGLGLNVGNGYTDIGISPSAIYKINEYISIGTGLQLSYVSVKNNYNSFIYGASLITLVNPIDKIQLSLELEQLKVNTHYESYFQIPSKHFWNTGLFLGAGYRTNNVTIGGRYNVLYDQNDGVYSNAFMPFIRVYF